jgi:hypothetical protein
LTKPTIKINWKVHSQPSGGFDSANSVYEHGDYIYVFGFQYPNNKEIYGRFEKRHKADGALVKAWTSKEFGYFSNCVIIDDKLYVFDAQNILVFDLDLNLIKKVYRRDRYIRTYLTFYNDFLYVAAARLLSEREDEVEFIVEKWRVTDLTLIKRRISYVDPSDIVLNPITKQLWVTGSQADEASETHNFGVEILDLDLNRIKVITKTDVVQASGADFDEKGYTFIFGFTLGPTEPLYPIYPIYGRLFKYDKYGDEVASVTIPGFEPRQLKYINNYVYVAGNELGHVLRIFDKNLNQIDRVFLSPDADDLHRFPQGRMAFDGKNLYIAGQSRLRRGSFPITEWTIYSISITSPVAEIPQPKLPSIHIPITGPVDVSPVDLGVISSLRVVPLGGLVSGYGCSGSRRFEVVFSSDIAPKEFEGRWICCLLGYGGWGCAYLCIRGDSRVVFKVPRGFEVIMEGGGEIPTVHKELLEKIKREAEVMGSLDHPNIIRLIGAFEKAPIVAYEYADYGSLYWQLAHGWRPSLRDILLLGIQLGDAVRYVHSRGLVHGDIKPGNVFIKDGIGKLGDFSSIVRLLSSSSFSKMVSTVGFRAPEQVYSDIRRKARELGVENRVDVYQLGNTILYTLTGESIDGEEAVDDKLISETLHTIPNEELKSILAETLKLEPEKRPSAEEFIKKLYNIWRKT